MFQTITEYQFVVTDKWLLNQCFITKEAKQAFRQAQKYSYLQQTDI